MLSVDTGLNAQSAALLQTPSSPLGPTLQDEEKKKQSHIPTVQVSAAQAQNLSARVGDFLANQTTKPQTSGASSDAISPTGADGAPPPAAQAAAPPPPPPAGDGGSSTDGKSEEGAIALALLNEANSDKTDETDEERYSDEDAANEEAVDDGDEDDATYSASLQPSRNASEGLPSALPPGPGTFVNVDQPNVASSGADASDEEYSEDQKNGREQENVSEAEEAVARSRSDAQPEKVPAPTTVANGNFSLQFDEAGTYSLAVA